MNNFLRVRDLKVHFPTDDGVVKAVDGTRSVNDLTLAMPDCDAVGDILVLNNPGQDVTLTASN